MPYRRKDVRIRNGCLTGFYQMKINRDMKLEIELFEKVDRDAIPPL